MKKNVKIQPKYMNVSEDSGDGTPSVAHQITEAIADETNAAIEDVEPLHSSIESQALDELLGKEDTVLRVDFIHGENRIVVSRDRTGLNVSVI